MEWITDPNYLIAFLTLTILEIVLGIDNIVFISIVSGKLPEESQPKARFVGLALAMIMRILLLLSLTWIMRLTSPLFEIFSQEISGRDLILIIGGLFLIGKSTFEIHDKLEGEEGSKSSKIYPSFANVIIQILLLDLVFSLDSVITAVGMVDKIGVMISAVVIAVIFMMIFATPISNFVHKHPTIKILALSFLILIGLSLVTEGFDQHIPKGYIYFAMAFSIFVEMINIKVRGKATPVKLKERYSEEDGN
ncbi:MAG: TerC family protein [Ignavibacteriales bacterium]|nr:MAG: TerC family protein [Ignavibacteriales bacterium]